MGGAKHTMRAGQNKCGEERRGQAHPTNCAQPRNVHRNPWMTALALTLACLLSGGCYVLHLAGGQLSLVNDQIPLRRAIQQERDSTRRALLAEVPHITEFAVRHLGMDPSKSYVGYYPVDRDYLTLILSASERDSLTPVTRWYPFAGRVPYRSFFDRGRAEAAQHALEADGYDTYLHESPAYSTLGFFRDPITSPMLDDKLPCPPPTNPEGLDGCRVATLAETVLHELTHQQHYRPGDTDFNEQLASFVGRTGAIEYLVSRGLYDAELRARLTAGYAHQERFHTEVAKAVVELRQLYAQDIPLNDKLAQRAPIFEHLSARALVLFPERKPEEVRMNNARVLQYVRYDRSSVTFRKLFDRAEQQWARFWPLVEDL